MRYSTGIIPTTITVNRPATEVVTAIAIPTDPKPKTTITEDAPEILSWFSVTWTSEPFVRNHRKRREEDAQETLQLQPPEEKVAILRRHLVDRVPASDLCDEYQLSPRLFYEWQKLFFENGASAFRTENSRTPVETARVQQLEEKLQRSEQKLQRKHEVLSELMEEHVKLKKELGEL